jgi:hypothetical protein
MSNPKRKQFSEEGLGENVWNKDEGVESGLECDAVLQMFQSSHDVHHDEDLSSETPVHFYQTTRRNIPKDSQLHIQSHENLKS